MFNLAANAEVTTNATCGQLEPEIYCRLVEHVYVREPQCGVRLLHATYAHNIQTDNSCKREGNSDKRAESYRDVVL